MGIVNLARFLIQHLVSWAVRSLFIPVVVQVPSLDIFDQCSTLQISILKSNTGFDIAAKRKRLAETCPLTQ